jgi:hypothetical protein
MDVTGILRYAGFDVGAFGFERHKQAAVGYYFTINPYIGGIDTEEDINILRDFRQSWNKFITPTVGVAFSTEPQVEEPIWYFGGALRFTRAFRFIAGWAIYQRSESGSWSYRPSLGFSLNIIYLGEFLKILGNAGTSITAPAPGIAVDNP